MGSRRTIMKSGVAGLLLFAFVLCPRQVAGQRSHVSCYDARGVAQRCIPPFMNAAYDVVVEATNTCGLTKPQAFCLQTGVTGATKSCDRCDAKDSQRMHPSRYLTDFNNNENRTWWQSETMADGNVQYPHEVNLTLRLGKSFDITYVRLKFYSSRPESFKILKRTSENHPWVVYQMYSASCEETYNVPEREIITRDDEQKAVCTDEFSDISPLSGASVVFSTLEGRPSAYEFENSPELQEWVTATDIRITLTRMNTFRDEVFGDPSVLSSYFYAISDFSVGGRCKCNGHASECVKSTGQGLEERMVCRCEHHTNGLDCSECLPFYNDRPWQRATATDAHECIACDCNGLSNRCYFDEQLFRETGHGGHCLDCRENTAGPHCDRCKDNYFRISPDDRCEPCQCNPTGSETGQCDDSGRCECKPGVTGPKCDRCLPNHYEFGPQGCKQCACEVAGSRDNNPVCSSDTGVCVCKETVEGRNCDRCKPGFFNMDEENSAGCMACFCHGHASSCDSASGYRKELIQSDFSRGQQMWTAEDQNGRAVLLDYSGVAQALGVSSSNDAPVYFVAPARYLGNQRLSYSQYLKFKLRVGQEGARASAEDIIIEGNDLRVTAPIYGQDNDVPRTVNQEYKFRLYDAASLQWTPKLSAAEFQRMLGNLTAIKIRGSYTNRGIGYIDDVWLESAAQGSGGEEVTHVEQCQCPPEYVGQFCESCAAGYHRDPAYGGVMARCVPCRCNGHSDTCDVNTGRCICEDSTFGDHCEKCMPGYYGNALQGTPGDCKTCPCPEGGECVELVDGEVACINCKEGYTGNRCEVCADGYWGDPEGRYGPRRPCTKCICSDNIDPNAVGNCNTRTGECLKCIYNTTGWNCDKCLTGYYGNAMEHKCSPCECHVNGSTLGSSSANQLIPCDQKTGQCQCHFRVTGRRCDQCDVGYWNIDSKRGCEQCLCDVTGSNGSSCDISTGQCNCKPGVGSRRCDNCAKGNYGFTSEGCKACQCNMTGSIHDQCDLFSGQCPCKTNVVGLQCQSCAENKFNMSAGCVDCPACYNLVHDRVNIFRKNLEELKLLIANIGDHPQAINDTDFVRRIREVNASVTDLLDDARRAGGGSSDGGALAEQLEYIRLAIIDLTIQSGKISGELADAQQSSANSIIDVTEAERLIVEAELHLEKIEAFINTEGRNALDEAASKAGQQSERMTEIARLAREEVERQEADAKRIEETAAKALNTSREALRIAQEALQKPKDVSEDLSDLRRQLTDMEQLYQQTKSMADQALTQAQKTYTQSLTIYTESESLTITKVDTAGLKKEAADVKTEAARIKLEATNLIEQHRQLMEDVNKERREAEKLLEEGIEQQQIADGLLADADAARDIARQAIAQSEKILRDAQESLKTLQEFDKKVQESKKKAEEALKKVPEIEASIEEAEEKTRRALDDLADAEENARLAREIAELAQGVADMASEDASKLKTEADALRKKATELKEEADRLSQEVDDILKRLEALERQAREDETVIKEALEKAGQAKTDATATSEKVTAAMATVKEISDILANLEEIDVEKLDQLEQSLNSAEQRLVEADIEQRYQDLVSAQQLQRQWVQTYAADLIQLHRDVDNVRLINATIPRTCYSNIELEKDPSSAFAG